MDTPVANTRSTNAPAQSQPHVVIIGAGFGGLQAARALGKAPVRLTVIDRNNYHLFQPMLYQVATAGLSPDDISTPVRSILRRQANTEVLMAEVTGIDTQGQRVRLHDQAIPFDYLIVATGATNNYFGHQEWAQFAPGIKSLDEGIAIRNMVLSAFEDAERENDDEQRQSLLTFVLVGGGPTGVELAGALADLARRSMKGDFRHIQPSSARILLVEGERRIIPMFPAPLTRKARRKLKSIGVEIHTGVHVTAIDANSVMVGDQRVETKNVIWTAGVKASPAGQWLGAEVDHDGRVKVQPDLTIAGHPTIFVLGDTSTYTENGKHLPGVAPVAIQQGSYAASVIAARVAGANENEERERRKPFHYRDKGTLATVGHAFAVVDIGPVRFTGFFAWLVWLFVHLFFLIGFRNRFVVLFQYAWSYITYRKGVRVILPEHITSRHSPEDVGATQREH